MNGVLWVRIGGETLQGFHCRMYSTMSLRLIKYPKLAGRGLEDLEPDGLFNMEDIPVLLAWT